MVLFGEKIPSMFLILLLLIDHVSAHSGDTEEQLINGLDNRIFFFGVIISIFIMGFMGYMQGKKTVNNTNTNI